MNRRRSRWKGKGALRSLALLFREFYKDGGMFMAASISYYALLSLAPLLYFFINTFAYFIGASPGLQNIVFRYVRTVYPLVGETLTGEISRIVQHTRLGWISLAIFLWMGSLVFVSLEYSVNVMYRTEKKRHFVTAAVLSFSMVMVSGILMAVSFWSAYIPVFIRHYHEAIPWPGVERFLSRTMVKLVSFAMTAISFTALYKALPKSKVPLRFAVLGGLVAAPLWEVSKYAFAWYVGGGRITGIYGSLSAIVMFLLWIFYSATIFLLVAKMVYLAERGEIT